MNTTDTTFTIAGLNEFTLYSVSVSAFTVGEGPSASVQVRTDSDGEWVCVYCVCTVSGYVFIVSGYVCIVSGYVYVYCEWVCVCIVRGFV